jgi:ribosomal protein L40E
MTEAKARKANAAGRSRGEGAPRRQGDGQAKRRERDGSDEAERSLGRAVAIGLPAITVLGAIAVGVAAGLGSGLLVLASGGLLGTIALLWASVRTLSGDAPLQTGFQTVVARRHGVDALGEEKRRVLRALKDLEVEHALGKIDDADYEALVARYRADAKAVMREMDREIGPLRTEAERIAREYLGKRGLVDGEAAAPTEATAGQAESKTAPDRAACAKCGASNESDAAFCKKCGAAMKDATEKQDADA